MFLIVLQEKKKGMFLSYTFLNLSTGNLFLVLFTSLFSCQPMGLRHLSLCALMRISHHLEYTFAFFFKKPFLNITLNTDCAHNKLPLFSL